jgi:DNA adenine methylase
MIKALFQSQLRPPLKWAGGKRWQLPYLRPIWSRHSFRRLIEPFAGGISVTLGLMPERALLNDVNPYLINFYRWVQRGLKININMRNDPSCYYANRERFNELIRKGKVESSEVAALFYYLNRTGYNGLCRFNKNGYFNVPFGRHKTVHYLRDFSSYRSAFARWTFINADFESVPLEPDDFVYADPPYDVDFTQYSKDGFGWDDQVRTAEWLSKHLGPVILVNQATDRIVSMYKSFGFSIRYLSAPRMVSCNGDRTPAREVMAHRNV